MKSLILAALAVTVLASAVSVQAAERPARFDGYKFFADIASRAGQ
jgi:hypothetical protein